MNESGEALGYAVHMARMSRNLKQDEVAEMIGVCKRTICSMEKNEGNPKFDVLYRMVRKLDLPLDELFYPEMVEDSELRTEILEELEQCTESELKTILRMMRGVRNM